VLLDAGGDPAAALPSDAVLVVGSERSGVGAELRGRADLVLALPMRPGVSSLNLATATAAALYRWLP
jgi:tRNA G18 (ribose-2'-O)-methylase SpoU